MKQCLLLLIFLSFGLGLLSQNIDDKIDKRLNRLFNKGKLEKCEIKSKKYRTKYPASDIPEYWLSKINFHKFIYANENNNYNYNYFSKAVSYSSGLADSAFYELKIAIRDSAVVLINTFEFDSLSRAQIRFIDYFKKHFSDTLLAFTHEDTVKRILNNLSVSLDSVRFKMIDFAAKLEGVPYKYAGESPETGFDCSGFTKYVYQSIGIDLPHNANKQCQLSGEEKDLSNAEPGDLVFFGYKNGKNYSAGHAGIIFSVEEDEIKVIHCVSGGVSIDGNNSSFDRYWKDKIIFVKTIKQLSENITVR